MVDMWWTGLDYLRAVWHMGLEIGRNSLQLLVPFTNTGPSAHSRRRHIQLRRRMNSRSTTMPELEEDGVADTAATVPRETDAVVLDTETDAVLGDESDGSIDDGLKIQWNQNSIEPAFLRDSDYPAGWLVYHPVLGVVDKVAADKYNKEQERQGTPDVEDEQEQSPSIDSSDRERSTKVEDGGVSAYCQNGGYADAQSPPPAQQASGVPVLRSIAASG